MRIGFVMLAHEALHRAGAVAAHLARAGAPVVVHIDRRASAAEMQAFAAAVGGAEGVELAPRRRCEWGRWSLVAATQEAAAMLLARHPEVTHVCLISGGCLPLRPLEAFEEHLRRRPGTDLIEANRVEDVLWPVGGLSEERFTLRFPFSWRRHRRLFDRYVRLQRRIGYRRRIPEGITPHIGSQWWCLTRETLTAILGDPERPRWERYFRRTWIPDESYFQTLARRWSPRIESRSPTFSRFDPNGRPYLLYDDHLELLELSDRFLARKVWPGAEALYRRFLDPGPRRRRRPDPARLEQLFDAADRRHCRGRPGVYAPFRNPQDWANRHRTAGRYVVLMGHDALIEDLPGWIRARTGAVAHGHLFAPGRVEFAGGAPLWRGCLPASAPLRDHNPRAFLANLVRNAAGETQAFMFGPGDRDEILPWMAGDANATILVITGAWLVGLLHAGLGAEEARADAVRLQKAERAVVDLLDATWVQARVQVVTLAEFLAGPMPHLNAMLEALQPGSAALPGEAPRLVPTDGLLRLIAGLRDIGAAPRLAGEFGTDDPAEPLHARAGE